MNDKPIIIECDYRKWCISQFRGKYYLEEVTQPSGDFRHITTEENLLDVFRKLTKIIERGL